MGPHRDEAALDRWLRRLACRLAGADRADDLVQEAWLAALRGRRPRGRRRQWLAAILRNLTRLDRRREARRLRRERAAARSERVPAAADHAAHADTRRAIADAMRGLAEPYRRTVLARFHDGETAAEIARREGVPASTVRNRLRRALARLRAELGRDPRLAVPLLLLPRPRRRARAVAAAAGILLLVGAPFAAAGEAPPEPVVPASGYVVGDADDRRLPARPRDRGDPVRDPAADVRP